MSKRTPVPSGDALYAEVHGFRAGFKTVVMASSDGNGQACASYAPYIADSQGRIAVFVSELAQHTANLRQHKQVSLLFIEDEGGCANPFARRRLSYDCAVTELDPADPVSVALLDQMEQTFGATVRMLRTLPDFHLLLFTPNKGNYIKGFGAAYQWQGAMPSPGQQAITARKS